MESTSFVADFEQRLATTGMEIRAGELRGAATRDPRGLRVRMHPFYGHQDPAPGQVLEVEWRDGSERYGGLAPVLERGRGTFVLGPLRHVRSLGPVQRLDWNVLVVEARNGRPWDGAYRVQRADGDRLHVVVPVRMPVRGGDLWRGRLRRPDGRSLAVVAQAEEVPALWTASGHRVAIALWRPI